MSTVIPFEDLIGSTELFFGVDGNTFCLGSGIYEAVQDPDDGYRSYCEDIEMVQDASKLVFFKQPIARVRVEKYSVNGIRNTTGDSLWFDNFRGWRLVDIDDGHEWLIFGTDNTEDYYPCALFSYVPKENS